MNCKEIEEELTALVDNETTFFRKIALRIHLLHCNYCRKVFEIEASLKGLVRARATSYGASQKLKKAISEKLHKTTRE